MKMKGARGRLPIAAVMAPTSSEAVGPTHAGIAHRNAAGLDVARKAPIDAAVRVAGDDEVIPLAGRVQIPVEFRGVAGSCHFDIPRRAGTAVARSWKEDRGAEAETGDIEVGSPPEIRHRAEADRMEAGTRTEARTRRLRRGGYRGAN